jgi:predicted O-methyltransferase YrrM
MMNTILDPLLNQGGVVYLDDILIYAKTMEEHRKLVKTVFWILQKEGLAVAPHKSFFHVKEVEFLRYIINANGVEMGTRKVEAVGTWETPKNLKDVQ